MCQNVEVRIISLKLLREFWERHADAEAPLRQWYRIASAAPWANLAGVRETYPHADAVRSKRAETLTVFNFAGNKCRLVTRIRYDYRLINVRAVLTHARYDEGKWKE